jgi:hypothetical protein
MHRLPWNAGIFLAAAKRWAVRWPAFRQASCVIDGEYFAGPVFHRGLGSVETKC